MNKKKAGRPKLSPEMKKLSLKKRKFVTAYVKSGNKTRAVMEAYGYENTKSKKQTAAVYGSTLTKQPEVKAAIRSELASIEGLQIKKVLQRKSDLLDVGEEQLGQQKVTPELYNKTLDSIIDLYKSLDIQNSQQLGNSQVHYHLHQAPTKEVLEKRQEYAEYFAEIEKD